MTRHHPVLLGLDVGTSATKATLAEADRRVVASGEIAHEVDRPDERWAEQDAEGVWWQDVVKLCRQLNAGGHAPEAIAVSGMGPCVLVTDGRGRPLRPAILYGIDTRSQAEIAELTEQLGAEQILARCGSPLTSQAVGPKLLWLRRHERAVWSRTRRVFTAHSYLVFRLTGEYVLDHHAASQFAPLYDLEAHEWIADWAAEVAPGLELPRLAWPAEPVGGVSAVAAKETGLRQGTPVAAGTIDTRAEAVSVGVVGPGQSMIQYASTIFVLHVLDRPLRHPRLWATVGVLPATYNLGAGMATSGALMAWFHELTGAGFDALADEAASVAPGSHGLVVLPYFSGERTPLLDPNARGVVAGLTLRHGRGHLYRALLEGTAFAVRHNLETMAAAGAGVSELVATGGGLRTPLWPQIVSDVTGVAQVLPVTESGAALGDTMLAAAAAGLAGTPPRDALAGGRRILPRRADRARYDRLYRAYRALYSSSADVVHGLAALQEEG
ncbi:MAG TPA: FGGY family carbohydrate kinase [Candidatus Limnocylindrales bacterium]